MRRVALFLVALIAVASVPRLGRAQVDPTNTGTGATTAQGAPQAIGPGFNEIRAGDDLIKLRDSAFINIDRRQCMAPWTFEFTNLPLSPELELWVSAQNVDCSSASGRTPTAGGLQPPCWRAGTENNAQGKDFVFRVDGNAIFDEDRNNACDLDAQGRIYYLWFVPLQSKTPLDSSTAPPAIRAPFKVTLRLYTEYPDPPTDVEAGSGESSIPVSWQAHPNAEFRYQAYFQVGEVGRCDTSALTRMTPDTGADVVTDAGAPDDAAEDATADAGVADAAVEDEVLDADEEVADTAGEAGNRMAGSEVDAGNPRVFVTGISNKPSFRLKDLDDKGIEIPFGTQIAVSGAIVDPAGNAGYLSDPICVTRIETDDAIDLCGDGDPERCGLETCALSPTSRGSWAFFTLFGLAVAALIRRRTA